MGFFSSLSFGTWDVWEPLGVTDQPLMLLPSLPLTQNKASEVNVNQQGVGGELVGALT